MFQVQTVRGDTHPEQLERGPVGQRAPSYTSVEYSWPCSDTLSVPSHHSLYKPESRYRAGARLPASRRARYASPALVSPPEQCFGLGVRAGAELLNVVGTV